VPVRDGWRGLVDHKGFFIYYFTIFVVLFPFLQLTLFEQRICVCPRKGLWSEFLKEMEMQQTGREEIFECEGPEGDVRGQGQRNEVRCGRGDNSSTMQGMRLMLTCLS